MSFTITARSLLGFGLLCLIQSYGVINVCMSAVPLSLVTKPQNWLAHLLLSCLHPTGMNTL